MRPLINTTPFAARDFWPRQGASDPSSAVALLRRVDAHTLAGSDGRPSACVVASVECGVSETASATSEQPGVVGARAVWPAEAGNPERDQSGSAVFRSQATFALT